MQLSLFDLWGGDGNVGITFLSVTFEGHFWASSLVHTPSSTFFGSAFTAAERIPTYD